MKNRLILPAVLFLTLPGAALADAQLADDKQCTGCHALTTDGAGPSFQRISRALKSHSRAEELMVRTIRRGSASTDGPHWGKASMPDMTERPLVSEAEARKLARWILSL